MNQRSSPRMGVRTAVCLHCPARGIHYHSFTHDIGTGGLCVTGPNSMHDANELSVELFVRQREVQIPARVAWAEKLLLGVEFVQVTPAHCEALQDLISPNWDGDNLLEGLILFGPHMSSDSLSDWLRITTLLEKHLRQSCRLSRHTAEKSTTSPRTH